MACRRITPQEYENLPQSSKNKPFDSESECNCCDNGCPGCGIFGQFAARCPQGLTEISNDEVFWFCGYWEPDRSAENLCYGKNAPGEVPLPLTPQAGKCCRNNCYDPWATCPS